MIDWCINRTPGWVVLKQVIQWFDKVWIDCKLGNVLCSVQYNDLFVNIFDKFGNSKQEKVLQSIYWNSLVIKTKVVTWIFELVSFSSITSHAKILTWKSWSVLFSKILNSNLKILHTRIITEMLVFYFVQKFGMIYLFQIQR